MSKKKVGRNEPCICGSGKKYKHCCGSNRPSNSNRVNSVASSNGINPNYELDRLHQQLQTFAFEKYGNQIKEQSQQFEQPTLKGNAELINIYLTGLTLWIITKLKFINNNQTIMELFYRKVSSNLSPLVRHLFNRWMNANPSIYEVISVPDETQFIVELRDLQTNKHYSIPYRDGDEYIKGSLVIGTLVPFAGYYSFLLTVIKLYGHNYVAIHEMVNRYAKKKGGLSTHFPKVLAEALQLGINNDEDSNPLYEQVVQTFADHMVEKGIDDSIILQGLDLWKKFCEKETPSFKKVGPYAAALEYYVQRNLLRNEEVTQNTVAVEYDASLSSVSTNYRKLANVLEVEAGIE